MGVKCHHNHREWHAKSNDGGSAFRLPGSRIIFLPWHCREQLLPIPSRWPAEVECIVQSMAQSTLLKRGRRPLEDPGTSGHG